MPLNVPVSNAHAVSTDFEDSLIAELEVTGLQYFEAQIEGKHPGLEITISGGVEKFIEAVKAVDQNVVFYEPTILDEDDFFVDSYDADDEGNAEEDKLDLRTVDARLKQFNVHVGEVCLIRLVCNYGTNIITIPHAAPWYDDFLITKIKAEGDIDEQAERLASSKRAEAEEAAKKILSAIKKLRHDDAVIERVVKGKATQRALIGHITEIVPGADTLDRAALAAAVTALRDGILMDTRR